MFWSVLSRIVLTVILFSSGVVWGAPPVILSALFIGGSAVHLLWGAVRGDGRLRGHAGGLLPPAVETRIREVEERQDAEISYLEERSDSRSEETTRRLADLEDRLEFAETTIARLRDTDPRPDPNRLQVMTPI